MISIKTPNITESRNQMAQKKGKFGIYDMGTVQYSKPTAKDPYKITSTKTQMIGFGPVKYETTVIGGKKSGKK